MSRVTRLFLALLVAVGWSASAAAQGAIQYDKIEIKTDKLASNLYMLSGSEGVDPGHPDGAGGRIGVLAGPDGIFMVDAQYLQIGDKVLAAVRRIDSGPIRFLVDTHIHGDHTAGNATFAKLGALLLSREELREGMVRQGTNAQSPAGRDPARLPVLTYGMGDPVRLRMNGETVELIPVRAAHTGGDTIVRFVNADVIMIGDFYRNFGYPFIDTANGGSLKGALDGLELTMKIAGANTRLIPGHGTYINRNDIVPYRDMILDVQSKVQQLIAQGKTLQEVLAAKVTSSYDAKVPGGLLPAGPTGTSADRFVSMVYSQLKGGQ
ncbi:MAG TPA: MBL fold metallo-hydrolase [Vicinamibacterales bacterium]|nr:MBL fold metallo-hydrolase [Vicinamibacterales bacterium]